MKIIISEMTKLSRRMSFDIISDWLQNPRFAKVTSEQIDAPVQAPSIPKRSNTSLKGGLFSQPVNRIHQQHRIHP